MKFAEALNFGDEMWTQQTAFNFPKSNKNFELKTQSPTAIKIC